MSAVRWGRRYGVGMLALTSATLLVSTACSSSSSTGTGGSSAGGSISVGVTLPLSGPLSFDGQATQALIQSYFAGVNQSGGIDGHKITATYLDDGGIDPSKAAANVLQLSQQHVTAIIGGLVSNGCTASAPIAQQTQTPLVCLNVDPADVSPPKQYVFLGGVSESDEVSPLLDFAKTVTSGSNLRVAILNLDDEGADAWASALSTAAKNRGWTVVSSQKVPLDATSVNTEISQVIAAKPDIVFTEILGSFDVPLDKTLRASGSKAPLVAESDGMGYAPLATENDPNQYTLYPLQSFLTNNSGSQQMQTWVNGMKTLGRTTVAQMNPDLGPLQGMPAVALVAGLRTCGYPCSNTQLAAALDKTSIDYPGLLTKFAFSSSSHIGTTVYNVLGWDPATHSVKTVATDLPAGTS